jgi:hypothetical protein
LVGNPQKIRKLYGKPRHKWKKDIKIYSYRNEIFVEYLTVFAILMTHENK